VTAQIRKVGKARFSPRPPFFLAGTRLVGAEKDVTMHTQRRKLTISYYLDRWTVDA
jgi:hypothetical protein